MPWTLRLGHCGCLALHDATGKDDSVVAVPRGQCLCTTPHHVFRSTYTLRHSPHVCVSPPLRELRLSQDLRISFSESSASHILHPCSCGLPSTHRFRTWCRRREAWFRHVMWRLVCFRCCAVPWKMPKTERARRHSFVDVTVGTRVPQKATRDAKCCATKLTTDRALTAFYFHRA